MSPATLDTDKIKQLKDAMHLLADLTDSAAPLHQAILLLEIAYADSFNEKLEIAEMGKIVNISNSAVSRNVSALGEWHRSQRPGLMLVQTTHEMSDRRRKQVTLTAKGKTVIGLALDKLEA